MDTTLAYGGLDGSKSSKIERLFPKAVHFKDDNNKTLGKYPNLSHFYFFLLYFNFQPFLFFPLRTLWNVSVREEILVFNQLCFQFLDIEVFI